MARPPWGGAALGRGRHEPLNSTEDMTPAGKERSNAGMRETPPVAEERSQAGDAAEPRTSPVACCFLVDYCGLRLCGSLECVGEETEV
nr:unnamed protein product [Digitaria exilis]